MVINIIFFEVNTLDQNFLQKINIDFRMKLLNIYYLEENGFQKNFNKTKLILTIGNF